MSVIIPTILFFVGLVCVIKGADWLTDGAANIAEMYGIPTIVVGLTIVAIGSSAPEFVVSVVSAINGNNDMAIGNVVGSNIFNILGIIGLTALVRPIQAERANIRYDIPFMVLANVVVAITIYDTLLDPDNATGDYISRTDGLLMLCMFAIFMSYTMSIANNAGKQQGVTQQTATSEGTEISQTKSGKGLWKSIALVVVGLAVLVFGGDWLVDGASGIASVIGISDSIIALTIVSAGTSAPELAASVIAAKKGDTAMAVGNIVGSVVFNVFFVLGTSATITPLGVGNITPFDIYTLLGSSVLMWVLCRFGKTRFTLTRFEGLIMVLLVIAYYTVLVFRA